MFNDFLTVYSLFQNSPQLLLYFIAFMLDAFYSIERNFEVLFREFEGRIDSYL